MMMVQLQMPSAEVTGLPTGFPMDEMEKVVSLADVPLAAAGGEPRTGTGLRVSVTR